MEQFKHQVGQLIKEARIKKGLTQLELAKMLGVTKGAVSAYETGKQNLTIETLHRVSSALEIPINIQIG